MRQLEKISNKIQDSNPVSSPSGSARSNKSESGTSNSQGTQSGSKTSSRSQSDSSPHDEPISIVPKGLRAFDRNDRDFFLHLIPGPTDRLGTPESIRFWVHRLDVADQVDDISVGVIYGPSGSGKSSFVRAGLIPRLSENVIPVYVDCSAPDLAQQIVRQIHREIHEVPVDESLSKILRRIRKGQYTRQGDKLLLVLDQFEQWLSQAGDMEQEEVTVALRQCDPERVQALLLIRDEFWLSASQFLRFLGQRIEEKRNAMPLPLFDKRHARRVLEAIGRAYQVLPQEPQPLSKSQSRFVREAVDSLAKRDRVVCVHLSVFAETTKSMEWNFGELKAVGGWEGIGRDYVAGIFNNPETPVFIKRHSQEAWSILRQLLPQTASELKGTAVELESLYENSDSKMSRATFDELIRFLEYDCNLISRSESLDEDGDGSFDPSPKYGLTHDFLVKPIREWGHAKQNETLRGRATSEFTSLANQWELTKDKRFLPGIWDYLKYYCLVARSSAAQYKEYCNESTKSTFFRIGVLSFGLLILILSAISARSIVLESRVKELLTCDSSNFEVLFVDAKNQLATRKSIFLSAANSKNPTKRFRAKCVLSYLDSDTYTAREILDEFTLIDNYEIDCLRSVIKFSSQGATELFENEIKAQLKTYRNTVANESFEKDKTGNLLERCSKAAILIAEFGNEDQLKDLLATSEDPTPRHFTINAIAAWLDTHSLFELCNTTEHEDSDLVSGICSGIAKSKTKELLRENEISILKKVYVSHPHPGPHYAAHYCLKAFNHPVPFLKRPNDKFLWDCITIPTAEGEIPIPLALVQDRESERRFWVSVCEMPAALAQEFRNHRGKRKNELRETENDCDFALTSFFESLEIINWIDQQLFQHQPYQNIGNLEKLKIEPNSKGFKLITNEDFEIATRCNSSAEYPIGYDYRLADTFWTQNRKSQASVPNAFGIFGLHGEVPEWTFKFESRGPYPFASLKGFRGPKTGVISYSIMLPTSHKASFRITIED